MNTLWSQKKTSYRDGQRKAGCSWAGALAGAFRRHFAAFVRESKSSAIARRFPLSSYKRSTGWGKAGLHREGISLISASDSSQRSLFLYKRIPQQIQIYTYFDLISLQSLLYNASLSSPKNWNVSQFSSFESIFWNVYVIARYVSFLSDT